MGTFLIGSVCLRVRHRSSFSISGITVGYSLAKGKIEVHSLLRLVKSTILGLKTVRVGGHQSKVTSLVIFGIGGL